MSAPAHKKRICRHCGSPAQGNPCWYAVALDREWRRTGVGYNAATWRRSGADAPCLCDDYDDDLRAGYRTIGMSLVRFFCALLALAGIFWVFARWVGPL